MTPRLSSGSHRLFCVIFACALLLALLFSVKTAFAVNGEMSDGRYMDELGVCAFTPPVGWVLWDYYGLDVFSPAQNRDIRLSLIAEETTGNELLSEVSDTETATEPNDPASPFLKREAISFENTFSKPDFEILSLENRELSGHPGMEVCARATVENTLFPDTIIYIVRYYTPTHIVTMTLRCPPASLDEWRDTFNTAVDSITLDPSLGEGASSP
ncbi:MAG: hypothetical protein JW885_08010 [Deltaproteobacteria bacterium]|nr:hypothetical protein [Candidatus Zymogenaceae bacterium]